jgi:hypothetical protein
MAILLLANYYGTFAMFVYTKVCSVFISTEMQREVPTLFEYKKGPFWIIQSSNSST